ncbi:hypothetical protein [Hymenobacter terricola]|uniref:hypothetical protein n=1 Tax=Hymenobacter terricola TaxID=2819236 RepID=UPI001B316609|nr:hypothetical protein [Hymenobacter terricola]
MKIHYVFSIIIAACTACTSGIPKASNGFPATYSGGSAKPRFINVNLELESENSYTYSEFGTPNYSIEDSGTYTINDTTIILNSLNTLQKIKRRKGKMIDGRKISLDDSINHQKLFVRQKCSIHKDEIIIWSREAVANDGFGFSLYNYHKRDGR